jgi:hypothetical protein
MFELSSTFAVEDSEVVVRYEGLNRLHEPLFVSHLTLDGGLKVHPNTAYCSLSSDGTHINLILGDSPLPLDRDVEFGVRALYLKVSQGESVEGELRLAVPLHEWNAYSLVNRGLESEHVTVRRLVLHIDVVPQSKVKRMRPASTAPDHWSIGGQPTRCSVEIRLDAPLLVAKRSDNFPRP